MMPDERVSPAKHVEQLLKGGFVHAGAWHRDETSGSIRFEGARSLQSEAGVYAYVVNGAVHYVGSAQRGLRSRLRRYEITKTLRTSHRIRQEILAVLADGREIDIYTIVPPSKTVNGLPVDMVVGLEEGLIRSWRPVWNVRGMGGPDAVDESETEMTEGSHRRLP